MINSIAFTAYPVSNMAQARRFYESVLGPRSTYDFQDEWVEYDIGSGTFAITTTEMGHTPGTKGAVVGFEDKRKVNGFYFTPAALKEAIEENAIKKSPPILVERLFLKC